MIHYNPAKQKKKEDLKVRIFRFRITDAIRVEEIIS